MDNDRAQAILLGFVLILILAAVFVPVGAFYAYAFYQKSKRNRIREQVLSEQQQLIGSHAGFPFVTLLRSDSKLPSNFFPGKAPGSL